MPYKDKSSLAYLESRERSKQKETEKRRERKSEGIRLFSESAEYYRLYSTTIVGRYHIAKKNAKKRGMEFDLTIEKYTEIVNANSCHYCGKSLPVSGSGIDRKNEESYYRFENTVPCCKRCNSTFMNQYNYKQKLILAEAIKKIDSLNKDQHE